jgi:hypothetical protein
MLVRGRFVIADCGVRRGEHEPPNTGESSGIEDAHELSDVCLKRSNRVADGLRNTGNGREMDDGFRAMYCPAHRVVVRERRLHQVVVDTLEIRALPDGEVIKDAHGCTALDECAQ